MIDRSESHLIARERRNRTDGSPAADVLRARPIPSTAAHESKRAQRVEPTVKSDGGSDDRGATPPGR